jgi:hypothetical protein
VAHLFLGTAKDNAADRESKGRGGDRRPLVVLRGSKHGNAKLSEGRVDAIRLAYAAGRSQASLAVEHRVCRRTIGLALSGKTWGHV